MTGEPADTSHWNAYAARFELVKPPLRPSEADIECVRDVVRRLAPRAGSNQALLLGVTRELANASWEPPLRLLAVDRAEAMVRAIWPGDTGERRALVGDWLELTPPPEGFAVAFGDGVLTLFDYPEGYQRLAGALAKLVRPGGLLWLRSFCRPIATESVAQVVSELFASRIGSFHAFKWRLAMALQGAATRSVRLSDVWDCFERETGGVESVAERCGYPLPEVATIEAYRGVADCYSFPTAPEVEGALATHFELLETHCLSYELGERCPHHVFRRRE